MRDLVRRFGRASALVTFLVATASPVVAETESASSAQPFEPSAAVVKVYVAAVMPDAFSPWRPGWSWDVTGSGAVIDGGRIITNAHVVEGHTFVQVRFHGRPEKHPARVSFVSHVADLALLEMEDPAALAGLAPLELGGLPAIQDEVTALGFPTGGDTLSITRGVVARVEHVGYAQSQERLLAIQMDAAIAPGSSGGPLVQNGRLVGVAMQSSGGNETVGCAVPIPVVKQFLRDVEDGTLDGVPSLAIRTQTLENPALKRSLGVPEGTTGVLVRSVSPGSPVEGTLRAGDVLTSLDGREIADDGTVAFRSRERTDFAFGAEVRQLSESVPVRYLRDGAPREDRVRLTRAVGTGQLVPRLYDQAGDYYIFGGLAFLALTRDYVRRAYQLESFNPQLSPYLSLDPPEPGAQVVILQRVLTADVNRGYDEARGAVIRSVDGHPIRDLGDLVSLVEESEQPYVTFGYRRGGRITVDREQALREGPALLERHGLASDRSAGLVRQGGPRRAGAERAEEEEPVSMPAGPAVASAVALTGDGGR